MTTIMTTIRIVQYNHVSNSLGYRRLDAALHVVFLSAGHDGHDGHAHGPSQSVLQRRQCRYAPTPRRLSVGYASGMCRLSGAPRRTARNRGTADEDTPGLH